MPEQNPSLIFLRITPVNLTSSIPSSSEKLHSFLFKIGEVQTKSSGIGSPAEMLIKIPNSDSVKNIGQMKGIIKIFEIDPHGHQILASLGMITMNKIPKQKHKTEKIILKMRSNQLELIFENLQISQQNNCKQASLVEEIRSELTIPELTKGITQKKFNKDKRIAEQDCIQSPYLIDDSNDQIEKFEEMSISCYSQFSEQLKHDECKFIGEQLVEQRRKNRELETKIQKSNLKLLIMKKGLQNKKMQIKQYIQHFQKFTNSLQADQKGQYIFEMDDRKRQISLKYKINSGFKQNFEGYLKFMTKKIQDHEIHGSSDRISDNQIGSCKLIEQYQSIYGSNSKKLQQETSKNSDNAVLYSQIKNLQQQNDSLYEKLQQKDKLAEDLKEMNEYLQNKQKQIQNIIGIKENTIEQLKRMIQDNNVDMDALEEKNSGLNSEIQNYGLRAEQLKEQIFNLNQTIEGYRKKYGDLKIVKNKAIQMEIKECLRWIDQQQTKQEDQAEDSQLEGHSEGVGSVLKKIGQLESLPLQDIYSVRNQVNNVLKKLDELIKKNSI